MERFSHLQTVITTVFTRPSEDGRMSYKETRRLEIDDLHSGQFHQAFCVLDAELDRLNGVGHQQVTEEVTDAGELEQSR